MAEESLKSKAVKGVAWSFIGTYANKLIQFCISLVLARLLTPADYGLIGMLGFFMGLAGTIVDSGFSNALIQFKDRSNTDFCTVFYINCGLSILMYSILSLTAPIIADFYNQPQLTSIIRVYSLTLMIGALSAINNVRLTIDLKFKTSTIVTTSSALLSGCIGLVFAFAGYGVWSLIFQQLSAGVIKTILLFYYVRWIPQLVFSIKSFKRLFGYGSKLLASGLIHAAYTNMYPLVIGKQFHASDLGYVARAQGFNEMAAGTINSVLSNVAFPVLSKVQNDDNHLLEVYEKYIKLSAFAICPIILFLCGIAKPLILLLLTEKWAPSIILLQILGLSYIWDGITKINLNLLYVKGRSDLFLRLEIIKKTIAFIILIGSVMIGNLIVFCIGMTLYSCIALYLNTVYTKKILNFGFIKQMKQIFPYLFFSIIIMAIALVFSNVIKHLLLSLVISCIVCIPTYVILCRVSNQYALYEVVNIITPKLGRVGIKIQKIIGTN